MITPTQIKNNIILTAFDVEAMAATFMVNSVDNDKLFFLVVGMEIRREIHEGALSTLQQAGLPLVAALGGVIAPALLYLSINPGLPVPAPLWLAAKTYFF